MKGRGKRITLQSEALPLSKLVALLSFVHQSFSPVQLKQALHP
jgi:hypothetical protein